MALEPHVTSATTTRDYSRLARTAFARSRMQEAAAVVVGAGALGNEVVKNLALLGIGHITVIDRDVVEPSNLTRSVLFCTPEIGFHLEHATPKAQLVASRATEINPDVGTTAIVGEIADVGLGVLRRADVVFSCVDNEMARLELSWACSRLDRRLVDGGLGHYNYSSGQVTVFPGAEGPCYACRKPGSRRRQLMQEMQGREDPCWLKEAAGAQDEVVVTTPLMASAIAALQVETALRSLRDGGSPTEGRSWRLAFHPAPSMDSSTFQRTGDCPLHDAASIVRSVQELDVRYDECTPSALIRAAGMERGALRLDWPMTADAACSACGTSWRPWMRRAAFRRATCPSCGGRDLVEREVVTSISSDGAVSGATLKAIGQPAGQIYEVVEAAREPRVVHVETTGDIRTAAAAVGRPC